MGVATTEKSRPGDFHITVLHGSGFVRPSGEPLNASCLLRLLSAASESVQPHNLARTKILRSSEPSFDESFKFSSDEIIKDKIELSVWDSTEEGGKASAVYIGRMVLNLQMLEPYANNEYDLVMEITSSKKSSKPPRIAVRVQLCFRDTKAISQVHQDSTILPSDGASKAAHANSADRFEKKIREIGQEPGDTTPKVFSKTPIASPSDGTPTPRVRPGSRGTDDSASPSVQTPCSTGSERRAVERLVPLHDHERSIDTATLQQFSRRASGNSSSASLMDSMSPSDGMTQAMIRDFYKIAKSMALFSQIEANCLLALIKRMKAMSFPEYEKIVESGSSGNSMYFIVQGECLVAINGEPVVKLYPGDHFGEVALLLSEKRTADVYAVTEVQCFELMNSDLWEVSNEFPNSANCMYGGLKQVSLLRVKRNSGALSLQEVHPSAMEANLNPLSSMNSRDRSQRIARWRQYYESGTDAVVEEVDEEEEVEAEKLMFEEAMRISGVGQAGVDVLTNMNLFSNAPKKALAQLISKLSIQEFSDQETVIVEGDMGTSMYILDEGTVEIHVKGNKVAELPQGSFFGEVAVIQNQKRTATVVAKDTCRCLVLQQDDFLTVFNMYPEMYQILADLADARVHVASAIEIDEANAKSKFKELRRNSMLGMRIRFTTYIESCTAENLGVKKEYQFAVYISGLKAKLWSLGQSDTCAFSVQNGDTQIFKSPPRSGGAPEWKDAISLGRVNSASNKLSLSFVKITKRSGTTEKKSKNKNKDSGFKESFAGLIAIPVDKCIGAGGVLSTTLELQEKPNSKKASNSEVSQYGKLKLTIQISQPSPLPLSLLVPVYMDGAPLVQPVIDKYQRPVIWIRWKGVPEEDIGSRDFSSGGYWISVIDLVLPNGQPKGQLVTDMTKGLHAKTRMLLHEHEIHWGTVKTKEVKVKHQRKLSQEGSASSPRGLFEIGGASKSLFSQESKSKNPLARVRNDHNGSGNLSPKSSFEIGGSNKDFRRRAGDDTEKKYISSFKIVDSYSQYSVVNLFDNTKGAPAPVNRDYALYFTGRNGQQTPIGTIHVGNRKASHVKVDIAPGQDVIFIIHLALALGESMRVCPQHGKSDFADSFTKLYSS